MASVADHPRYHFEHADICDADAVGHIFSKWQPIKVMPLAAESHVDRSKDDPAAFIHTNVLGTQIMLDAARQHWMRQGGEAKTAFRFHHVSTDEVYGDLTQSVGAAMEAAPYRTSSPYAASKARADHLVRAWGRTYALPVLLTNCSNNYGPYLYPEKIIPLMILNALRVRP